jgi:hypothetical protein
MVAAVAGADGHVLHTICWKAPEQNPTVLSILRGFRAAGITVEVVMEPSGTYGEVLRRQLEQDAFPVLIISGKRTHDAKEIFDGVPSLHDAKAAAIMARLHADGLSTRLRDEGLDRRQLRAPTVLLQEISTVAISHRLMAMDISAPSPRMACLCSARLPTNRTSSAQSRPAKPRNPSRLFAPLLARVIKEALFAHGATRAFSSRTRALVQHAV